MNAVDTNVLIYACDSRDEAKQELALRLIEKTPSCVMLWQVACEFIAASRKLAPWGFTAEQAWDRLSEFVELLPLVPPSPAALRIARELHTDRQVAFWDAVLVAGCIQSGVRTLYSEDLPAARIPNLQVLNPFA
jgi:predicted nucleic acid-binding protein